MKIERYSEFNDIELNEAFWQDIKYGLSKLGRYKAGGKIFGKKATDEKSREEIKEIMKKESNKLLKQVYGEVKIQAPEFPNDRRRVTFLRGVILYGQFYDSLVAAAKKSPKEEGYMAPEIVNTIIEDLRKVVKKHLDVDLAAVYSVAESVNDNMTEEEIFEFNQEFNKLELQSINEEEEFLKKLVQLKDKAMDKLFGAKKGVDAEQKTTKGQSAKLQRTSGQTNVESERMKTLQSNKLPLVLAGVGGALGALGWIAQTQWFKDLITSTVEHPAQYGEKTFTSTIENNLKVDPRGWSYTIQNNGFMDATGKSLNFNQPIGNLKDAFKFYGGGDESKGIEAMSHFLGGGNQASSVADITKQLADPTNKTVGDVFNHLEGTWGDKFLMNQNGGAKTVIAKMVYTTTKKVLIRAGFTTTTTSVIGGKLVALAPVLMGAGIALVGAGALVKLLREKGQRQSRAKTLNDLLQSLLPVEVGTKQQQDEEKQDETGDTSKATEKSIYPLMIQNLTQLRSLIETEEGVSLEDGKKKGGVEKTGGEEFDKQRKRKREKVAENLILRYNQILKEEKTFGTPRNVEVTKAEDYLTQAVTNIRKSIEVLKDEKDKGIGITYDFISDILDKKMDSETKQPVKDLYSEVYDYLYGTKSETLSDFKPLYKESVNVISNKSKRQVVAEKMARFAKRAQQFEGEGFYGGMGQFGADLQDWNKSFKEIMDYFKQKSEIKESKIFRFNDI